MYKPTCATPIDQVNSKREITIRFPDATYTLAKLALEGTTLIAIYAFKDTTGKPLVPYENCYSLDAFDNITRPIRKIEFRVVEQSSNV